MQTRIIEVHGHSFRVELPSRLDQYFQRVWAAVPDQDQAKLARLLTQVQGLDEATWKERAAELPRLELGAAATTRDLTTKGYRILFDITRLETTKPSALCATIAHELGHVYFRHREHPEKNEDTREREADAYAVSIGCTGIALAESAPDDLVDGQCPYCAALDDHHALCCPTLDEQIASDFDGTSA